MWSRQVRITTRRWCSTTNTTAPAPTNERLVDRWAAYWKGLWLDYTTVAKDVATDARNRPLKAATIVAIAIASGYCSSRNPDETSFTDQLLNSSADLGMVSPQLQNKQSAEHVNRLRNDYNERRLHRLNLLLCSVMYVDNNSQNCCTYDANCYYLRTSMLHFVHNIVDIGFLDRWWILAKNMENYDIND